MRLLFLVFNVGLWTVATADGATPSISAGGIVNNANYAPGTTPLAPGSIAAIFGTNLTDGTSCLPAGGCNPSFDSDGRLNTVMSGAQVTVNGNPVPIFYATPTQLGIQIPAELSGSSATVQVSVAGQSSGSMSIPIGANSPGVFTQNQRGTGAGAITHASGTLVNSSNPAQPGEVIVIYATGLGKVTPPVATGALSSGITTTAATPVITIDGIAAEVRFSGLSNCCVGLNQINLVVPSNVHFANEIPVELSIGGKVSNVVTIATSAQGNPPPIVTHVIDPAIFNGPPSIADAGRGPRPLAAVADGREITSRFISNEVLFAGSQAELTAFLVKYNGKVIATVASPPGQPAGKPTSVIRLDPSSFSPQDLDTNAAKMSLRGQMTFSSDAAARLAALVVSESAAGSKVSLNFVSEGHDFLYSTTEQADSNGVSDAFQWPEFDARAWEFVAAHKFARRVKIAIIDGGFWLNSLGMPCDLALDAACAAPTGATAKGLSDLPSQPIQFNLIGGGSSFAGGANPVRCSGGSQCPWHGNKSASVAVGTLNNSAGAAGTGGQVADPILLKFDGSDDTVAAGILDAMGDGADIISMSFGSPCNDWCRAAHDLGGIDSYIDAALDAGILLVASAGNGDGKTGVDATDQQIWPCQYESSNSHNSVYCVGALNPANDGTAAPYSNFGIAVNIWTRTNIHAMPDGGSNPFGSLTTHTGTSASAPYVAGVAAMMKAINPSLDGAHLKSILGNAPYEVGTSIFGFPYLDPKVTLVLQPYKAVVAAAGGYHLMPDLRITAPQDGAVTQPGSLFRSSSRRLRRT